MLAMHGHMNIKCGLELTILLLQSPLRKDQKILSPTIFNNYPFLFYMSHCLNTLIENYMV